jgi:hypothetical protein
MAKIVEADLSKLGIAQESFKHLTQIRRISLSTAPSFTVRPSVPDL